MSHETYLTAKDQIETAVQSTHSGFYMSWGAIATTLAVASIATGGLAGAGVGVVLGVGAALAGLKMVSGMFENHKVRKGTDSPTPLSEYTRASQKGLAPSLANNNDPVPELLDDVQAAKWQKQVSAQAIQDAKRNDGHGY